jgi:hypothetical protein
MPRDQRMAVQIIHPISLDIDREPLSLAQQSMLDPNVDVWNVVVENTFELNLI